MLNWTCAHLQRCNLIQHYCLELLIADIPVAKDLMYLTPQLVDVSISAARHIKTSLGHRIDKLIEALATSFA